jgi:hypothetical protein
VESSSTAEHQQVRKAKEYDDKREVKDMPADSGPVATDNSH